MTATTVFYSPSKPVQTLKLDGFVLSITQGNSVDLSGLAGGGGVADPVDGPLIDLWGDPIPQT